jgi:hypothetical protein
MGGAGLGDFAGVMVAGAAHDGAVGRAVVPLDESPVFCFETVHNREGLVMSDQREIQ